VIFIELPSVLELVPRKTVKFTSEAQWSKERREMAASTTLSLIAQLEAGQFLSRAEAKA